MRAFERITKDPAVKNGLPCIRDTGISVTEVVRQVVYAKPLDEVLLDYPQLTRDDLEEALAFEVGGTQRMLSGLVHDFRAPVSSFRTVSQMMEELFDDTSNNTQHQLLRVIDNVGNGIQLKVSQIEAWASIYPLDHQKSLVRYNELIDKIEKKLSLTIHGDSYLLKSQSIYCEEWQIELLFDQLALSQEWEGVVSPGRIEVSTNLSHLVHFIIERNTINKFHPGQYRVGLGIHPLGIAALILENHQSELILSETETGVRFEFDLPIWQGDQA